MRLLFMNYSTKRLQSTRLARAGSAKSCTGEQILLLLLLPAPPPLKLRLMSITRSDLRQRKQPLDDDFLSESGDKWRPVRAAPAATRQRERRVSQRKQTRAVWTSPSRRLAGLWRRLARSHDAPILSSSAEYCGAQISRRPQRASEHIVPHFATVGARWPLSNLFSLPASVC